MRKKIGYRRGRCRRRRKRRRSRTCPRIGTQMKQLLKLTYNISFYSQNGIKFPLSQVCTDDEPGSGYNCVVLAVDGRNRKT